MSYIDDVQGQLGSLSALDAARSGKGGNTTITLAFKRLTANIAEVLPMPFGGSLHARDGYSGLLNSADLISTGTTISDVTNHVFASAVSNLIGNVMMQEYTNGANVDKIETTAKQANINVMHGGLENDAFFLKRMKFSVTAVADADQLDEAVHLVHRSPYGRTTTDTITPSDYIHETQEQLNIVTLGPKSMDELNLPPINRQRAFVVLVKSSANFTYTVTLTAATVVKAG